MKIVAFTDLKAWQEGHALVLSIYSITKKFPREEIFCLISQMRRAVVSITSNIAEGFGRPTNKEKQRFYSMALASLTELQNQIIISRDVGYISNEEFSSLFDNTITVQKITNGLIKSSKNLTA